VSEVLCEKALVVPPAAQVQASLCLTIDGAYDVDWQSTRIRCPPTSLMFYSAGLRYGVRISDGGSRCLSVGIDPATAFAGSDVVIDLERLGAACRAPPHWLAFELRREVELGDDLSPLSIASAVIDLIAELGRRPALSVRRAPPPWLTRVQERIDDEYQVKHDLQDLARTAGVHHVHLARQFRRHFGCTVGQLIRERRVEVACHRLTTSRDPLSKIALDAGFADQSHFSNTFRRMVGLTPRRFRARFGSAGSEANPLQDADSRGSY
jgi:AraC family transcriptional regulator